MTQEKFGFIMIRHVNSEETNKYWFECYKCIRQFYSEKIVIIDDDSDSQFLSCSEELIHCEVICSEFPKRAELLPYYYLHKYAFFDKAVILHDSVFFQKKIDFSSITKVKFLWHFDLHWDDDEENLKMIDTLPKNKDIKQYFLEKKDWKGCFGVQSVIDYSFLCSLHDNYRFLDLINYVDSRDKRMALERVFAVLCHLEYKELFQDPSLLGIIHDSQRWGLKYDEYLTEKKALLKVFTGR